MPSLARSKYTLPALDKHDELVLDGVPGLLTPNGFKTAYLEYQQHMIDELNASTAGTKTAVHRPPVRGAQ
jgi:Fe-Mn family superoxide dismutase